LDKKNQNFVTYVITLYNKRPYLKEVINALHREGGNLKKEFIIIDDGSLDNSLSVIKSMHKKLPGKLFVIRRKNMGASFSTNQGVKLARSYWIRLLDGDDLVSYKSTENMLNLARSNKLEFSYGLIEDKKKKKL